MNIYTASTLIQLTGSFVSTATGSAVVPSTVVCRVTDPTGLITDISSTVTNPSTGVYNATYTPLLLGMYQYEFIGSGSVQVAHAGQFLVNQVPF